MTVVDLLAEYREVVRGAHTGPEFQASFRAWIERQQEGALAPLLEDFRRWSAAIAPETFKDAHAAVGRLSGMRFDERAQEVLAHFTSIVGRRPEGQIVLVAGLRRPEGYSRFERGRNTVFIGLDHPNNLRYIDHFEMILAHELAHAVRDPAPAVLADYGGWPEMTHDDFVERYPFREHLVSEALATALSQVAYPDKPDRRYVYFSAKDYDWCERHRRLIAERMRRALDDGEDYGTFYSRESVAPGSPDCCDYYFGLHLGRYALGEESPERLIILPAQEFLGQFLEPFLEPFLAGSDEDRGDRRPSRTPAEPAEAIPGIELPFLPGAVKDFYRDLEHQYDRDPERALSASRELQQAVSQEGLCYAGEPYDIYDFPLALSSSDCEYLRWVSEKLFAAVEQVVELYRQDAEVRAFFDLPPHLEQLIQLEPGYRPYAPIARFDSYWNGKRVRFLELNTNGTAGLVLGERLPALFCEGEAHRDLVARHQARALPLLAPLREALLAAHASARAGAAPRRIAIVDWSGVPTRSELERIRDFLAAAGLPTVLADPADLSYDGRTLSASGAPIDLVYRRLTTVDVLQHAERLEPLLEAARRGDVVVAGSFAADLAHSKRMFAFLTHERWRARFSIEQRTLIDAHVPWTRIFRPQRTLYGGTLYDLRELALEQRKRFVLKPSEGHEGRGVLLGPETAPRRWRSEIDRRYGGDEILQEYVPAPVRTFRVPDGRSLAPHALHLHLGEYMLGGRLAGFLARASEELVLCATSTERAIPCLQLEQAPDASR